MQSECLNEMEKRILYLLANGYSKEDAASILFYGVDTIKYHTKSIFKKLSVNNLSEAVVIAYKKGLLEETSLIEYFKGKI